MAGDPTDGLFHLYRGLIGYAAGMYANHSSIVEPEDLFQDGCLWMLEFFNGRANTEDRRVHNTFKKSLFLWMRRTVKRRIKQARPRGRALVRLSSSGTVQDHKNFYRDHYCESHDLGVSIDFDRMLATVDTCVLTKLYAREFVAELRRVLRGSDLTVFNLIVESVTDGTVRHKIVREAAIVMDTTALEVHKRVVRIRDAAMRVLARSA